MGLSSRPRNPIRLHPTHHTSIGMYSRPLYERDVSDQMLKQVKFLILLATLNHERFLIRSSVQLRKIPDSTSNSIES
ncbi:BgTH12-06899 [Blumeria graminis f. sp. triticale]|uniref:BgTH12-06899 n=1 Tax=Blumeria graminis f. sp. triticale TaxID=1689686 RepID=A0A9W4DCM2_BLUGR|nr:BgTH12-06899 [Blumeria graminis f. sp. triticale]